MLFDCYDCYPEPTVLPEWQAEQTAIAALEATMTALAVTAVSTFDLDATATAIAQYATATPTESFVVFVPGEPVPGLINSFYNQRRGGASEDDIAYEARVCERPEEEWDTSVYVDGDFPTGKEFDWYNPETGMLLDAKNWQDGGINDITRPEIAAWRLPQILDEARAQLARMSESGAVGVEWRVASETIAQALAEHFNNDIQDIPVIVVYYP
jgi:hypothetical protein